MDTKVMPVNEQSLDYAAELLRSGQLVALPDRDSLRDCC